MSLSGPLIYALLLSLQIVSPEVAEYEIDVIRGGQLEYQLRLEREEDVAVVFSADDRLLFEFEPSRRHPEIYTVYPVNDAAPQTVNLTNALMQLRSLSIRPEQQIQAGGDQLEIGGEPEWSIKARPGFVFLGGEFIETMLLIHAPEFR